MKRSNLRLRSNVHFRNPQLRLQEDHQFLPQVRGYAGVCALLRSFGLQPHQLRHDDAEVLRLVRIGKLTRAQQEVLKLGVSCSSCGSIPCGVDFRGEYKFVCDQPGCGNHTHAQTKAVMIRHRMRVPSSILRGYQGSLGEALSRAIRQCNGLPPAINLPALDALTVIEINPSAARQYTDEQLAAFLVYGIHHSQAR